MTSIKVAVRIRPLNGKETLNGSAECLDTIERSSAEEPQRLVIGTNTYCFDEIHEKSASQDEIFYKNIESAVENVVSGYNCTIIAYGQTGSGKTYTMGTGMDTLENSNDDKGILPKTIERLFERFKEIEDHQGDSIELNTFISFIEIHNENIIDLLAPASFDQIGHKKRNCGFVVREDKAGDIHIPGITEETVTGPHDILEFLRNGAICRTTGSTEMNNFSSRSHAIFTIVYRFSVSVTKDNGDVEKRKLVSKLHFVDLAGSERMKKTQAVGKRAKESISINTGLLALGNVISALGDESKKARHVPYRDSKLTRLLQDSLGGNSQTVFIACVSPATDNYSETLTTLQYANRARNIQNKATINFESNGDSVLEIIQLKKQIATLKKEIILLKGNVSRSSQPNSPVLNKRNGPPLARRPSKVMEAPTVIDQRRLDVIRESRFNMNQISRSLRKNMIDDIELVNALQNDENIRESLHQALEDTIIENNTMKGKYEERTKLLQSQVMLANKQRDQALKRISPSSKSITPEREKYEERIKSLGREINRLRRGIPEDPKTKELELAIEEAERWKKGFEFQKKVLIKKNEKENSTRHKLKELISLIKQRNITIGPTSDSPGIDLTAPEWNEIISIRETSDGIPEKELEALTLDVENKNDRNTKTPDKTIPFYLKKLIDSKRIKRS
eukprot:GHVP01025183.1.p1 GENE.GHVP01025183.1~~GHVP01025183.1.p1  ORF type:complete len:678 (+),score=140.01 GHVP01025183.1:34-2067(+)